MYVKTFEGGFNHALRILFFFFTLMPLLYLFFSHTYTHTHTHTHTHTRTHTPLHTVLDREITAGLLHPERPNQALAFMRRFAAAVKEADLPAAYIDRLPAGDVSFCVYFLIFLCVHVCKNI